MKLLLDEMYWPALAEQLVARGHDVIAASAQAHLSGIPDDKEVTLGALVTALDAPLQQDSDTSTGAWTTWL